MNHTIGERIKNKIALNLQTISTNTTTNGNIIDVQGFDAFEFYITSGTLTDGTYAILIQDGEESDLSDAADVTDENLTVTEASVGFADTDDNTIKHIGYIGNKRYVRLSIVSTGTTSGGVFGAVSVQGFPSDGPIGA